MMVAELSAVPAPGAAPAEPSVQGASGAGGAGRFAALVDLAAAGAPPAADRSTGANPPRPEGILHRTFLAEWCLAGPEPAGGVSGVDLPAAAGEVDPALEAAEPDAPVEPGEDGTDGVEAPAVVLWPPVQPPPQVTATPMGLTGPAAGTRPEAGGVRGPAGQVPTQVEPAPAAAVERQPPAVAPAIDGSIPTDGGTAGKQLEASSQRGASAEPSRAVAPAPSTGRPDHSRAADVLPAAEPPAGNAAAAPPPSVEVTSAAPGGAPAPVEGEGRRSAAAVQLRRAMERLGFEQGVPAVQGDRAASLGEGGDGSSDGENPGPAAGQNESAAAAAPQARAAHLHATGFAAHISAELTREGGVSSAGSVQPAPTPSAAPDADTTEQIVQAMRLQFRNGVGSAVVHLKPEHLGEVSISLRVDQQAVSATVHAEVPAVRQWLESQEASLRSGLSEQGLRLEEFVVREDESRRQGSGEPEDRQQERRPAPRRRAEGEPKFEVIV